MTTTEFHIPVNKSIADFKQHLLAHPRTILSAKFGDGKSYFLQHFMADETVKKDFVFLKLFPVNYQVVENKDIFDLIKYDIIFQLYVTGIISADTPINDKLLAEWFVMTEAVDITTTICKWGSLIAADSKAVAGMITVLSAAKPLKDLYAKWNEFKKNHQDSQNRILDFINTIDKHYLYECDPTTAFIKDSISAYKKANPDKHVAIVVEDLDRMDPAHLFRILNVLSAHVDYGYKYGESPSNKGLADNKFGVDNIVLVLDYNNLENIYHHFYGNDTNFEGYIRKFCTDTYFKYSLTEETYNYVIQYLYQETGLKTAILENMISPTYLEKQSLRTIVAAISDTRGAIFNVPKYKDINGVVDLPIGVLQVLVVLRRMGLTDSVLKSCIKTAIGQEPKEMMTCLGGYLLAQKETFTTAIDVPSSDMNRVHHYRICEIYRETGLCSVEHEYDMELRPTRLEAYDKFINWLLTMIVR